MPLKHIASIAVLLAATLLTGCSTGPSETFDTPQSAADTLVSALRANDESRLKKILGSDYQDLMYSGDQVADQESVNRFVTQYDQKHAIVSSDDVSTFPTQGIKASSDTIEAPATDSVTITVGDDSWPMAIPIVLNAKTNKWAFDTEAGRDELLSRRIGHNELATIQTCLAIVDAQREYAALDPQKSGKPNYASRLVSTQGKKDGLYWPTQPGNKTSPLGPLLAKASAEGYTLSDGTAPYYGYQYHMLKSQAIPGHPDRATINFSQPGNYILGFGVVAYPAKYGNSGIMTFIVNQRGIVYQKDLGPNTAKIASDMTNFNPADGWEKVDQSPK